MSGAEASTIVGLASGCIALIQTTIKVYNAAQDVHGLHQAFRVVYDRLPLVSKIIQQIENHYKVTPENEEARDVMNSCHTSLEELNRVFKKVLPGETTGRYDRYKSAIKTIKPGRAKTVERMMEDILKDLQLLQTHHVFEDLPDDELPKAIEEVSKIGPSIEEDNSAHNISADRGAVVPMGSGHTEVNQHWGKGDQWNNVGTVNFNKVIPDRPTLDPTPKTPCISVPFERTVSGSVYIERRELLQDLEVGMRTPFGNKSLAHGAAITGLGGTGKTQLALAYVELHLEDFDTILWFDAESEQTMRRSFVSHCRMLKLPLNENVSSDASLMTNASVEAVLRWLLERRVDQRWLVVIDGLDHIASGNDPTEMVKAIPRGRGGSVIITSQHESVLTNAPRIRVDQMTFHEARALLLATIDGHSGVTHELDTATSDFPDKLESLVARIVTGLDCLPFAVDLAGAAIMTDIDHGYSTTVACEQWLKDFSDETDKFLIDQNPSDLVRYNKTVWTVWNTTLGRVRNTPGGMTCIKLLATMSLLDHTCIQTEVFCLASLGLMLPEALMYGLLFRLPPWAQEMFGSYYRDGSWNDSGFRQATRELECYGLVRSVVRQGKPVGYNMHGLVSRRAKYEGGILEVGCYLLCVGAALLKIDNTGDRVNYKHLQVHMPSFEAIQDVLLIFEKHKDVKVDVLVYILSGIAQVWYMKKSWSKASGFYLRALQTCRRTKGNADPETIRHIGLLADCYCGQEQWKEAEKLYNEICSLRIVEHTRQHRAVATSRTDLARALIGQGKKTKLQEAHDLESEVASYWRGSPETDETYLEACNTQRPIESRPSGGLGLMTLDALMLAYFVQHRMSESELAACKASTDLPFIKIQDPPHWRSVTNRFVLLRLTQKYEQAQRLQAEAQRLLSLHLVDPLPDMFMSLVIATPSDVGIFLRCFTDDQLFTTRDKCQKHMLHWAAERGLPEAVNRCISLGVDVNVTDTWQSTPLHYASGKGHVLVVEALCQAGANLLAVDESGLTPFDAFKTSLEKGRVVSSDVGLYLATRQALLHVLVLQVASRWSEEQRNLQSEAYMALD